MTENLITPPDNGVIYTSNIGQPDEPGLFPASGDT
jgi:hypothetical protein